MEVSVDARTINNTTIFKDKICQVRGIAGANKSSFAYGLPQTFFFFFLWVQHSFQASVELASLERLSRLAQTPSNEKIHQLFGDPVLKALLVVRQKKAELFRVDTRQLAQSFEAACTASCPLTNIHSLKSHWSSFLRGITSLALAYIDSDTKPLQADTCIAEGE